MFSNFKKAFGKPEKRKIPTEIVDAFSRNLPEGLKYKPLSNDLMVVVADNDQDMSMAVSAKLIIPENMKLLTKDQLYEMVYRTQSYIKIDQEHPILINDIPISLEETAVSPLNTISGEREFILTPKPFPPPFEIELSDNELVKKILVQRQPLADLSKSLFKNADSDGIQLSLIVDEQNDNKLKFTLNFNLLNISAVNEMVETFKLYQSFIEGNGKIFGVQSPPIELNDIEEVSFKNLFIFWERIKLLQDELSVEFHLDGALNKEEELELTELYSSFVRKEPFKRYVSFDKISLTPHEEEFDKEVYLKNEGMVFSFFKQIRLNLLGVEMDLYEASAIGNIKIKDVVPDPNVPGNYDCIIDSNTEKRTFTSTQYFKNMDEADTLRNNPVLLTEGKELKGILED
ncbi:hypothetical protein ASD24_24370 [Paenibacillus sp. Root52]|uniref:abortive infection system toxin AbiGii family protein n=1 Tax=Paenibacillus sp. Root52 TaxID=1736552 RepID=UPI0006F6AB58|nr:abortive infection system toxin AbiGii family protein [Paenibacillus sp. Root52]KQY90936.1 hypothetical protein ASD24_24370 [Paenibacillus sp. Root52]